MIIHQFIALLILVLLSLTGILIYLAVYRKKINKQLRDKKSTAHIGMPPIASIVKVVFAGLMLYMMYSTMTQVQEIAQIQEDNTNLLNNTISNLTYQIDELESELAQQNTDCVLGDVHADLGDINYATNTAKVTVEVVMSKCRENTTLTGVVEITDRKIHLEFDRKADGVFRAEIVNYPVFELSEPNITLNISSGENEYCEELYISELSCPWKAYTIDQYGHTLEIEKKDGKLVAEGWFSIEEDAEALSIKELVVYDNGKEIKTIPFGGNAVEILEQFSENAQVDIAFRYQRQDNTGYIFEITVASTENVNVREERIFDENMKLVFKYNEQL